jgi:hypothetical protein
MAIQVSYLESKMHPDWGSFSKAFPHKSAQETVSAGLGKFTSWPRITARQPDGLWKLNSLGGEAISAATGMFPDWPNQTVKRETVKSVGKAPLTLPATQGAKHNDGWAEIGQIRWEIKIDGQILGLWAKLDGLSMKLDVAEIRTGDGMNYRWIEPVHSTFGNVKVTRAATAKGCAQVLKWLEYAQFGWKKGMTAEITGIPLWWNGDESTHFKLTLGDVMPVAWTGPSFASDGKIAMEVLEFTHTGFVTPAPTPKALPPRNQPLPPERKKPTPLSPPPPRTLASMQDVKF